MFAPACSAVSSHLSSLKPTDILHKDAADCFDVSHSMIVEEVDPESFKVPTTYTVGVHRHTDKGLRDERMHHDFIRFFLLLKRGHAKGLQDFCCISTSPVEPIQL